MTDYLCDFCSSPVVEHGHAAVPFNIALDGSTYRTERLWLACVICHDLIKTADPRGLFIRSGLMYRGPKGSTNPEYIAELHRRFWLNRTGPVVHFGTKAEIANRRKV